MTKPLLLLDVDGVLCPFGGTKELWMGMEREGLIHHPDLYIYTNPDNKKRLKRLHEIFEIHWCTTWGEDANLDISPLHDLPHFPVVDLGPAILTHQVHWKQNPIEAHVGDRPFAFVDDDIDNYSIEWAKERTERGIPTLYLPVIPQVGLTDAHVRDLEVWANQFDK